MKITPHIYNKLINFSGFVLIYIIHDVLDRGG